MSDRSSGSGRRRRRWVFGTASFDEGSWSLRIDTKVVPLEAKPSELLLELLLRPGEAVSKEELLDAVWPGVTVVEASLSVAISKLRKALGDDAGSIIRTIPRIGYMLAVPVSVESMDAPLAPRFAFTPGENVPNRTQWELVEALGTTGANDVWRARHRKTGQTRVFKFADAPDRLRSLKREASLFRLLSAAIGEDGPFAQLLEWNFETAPYFLESQDGGRNLLDWAEAQGGLEQIAADRRLAVARAIARALAQVHDAGVLHKDLKPANILIEEKPDNGGGADFRVRLVDFGDGQVVDAALFDAYAITGLPIEAPGMSNDPAGTALYRAPELASGALPTARSDIYALGLILYQLVVGDFRRTLAPGWEQDVSDPLLRQDIAEAAAGDPAQRTGSASALAERLGRLDERRSEAEAAAETEARLQALKVDSDRRKQRRPWVLAVAAAAAVGLLATTTSTIVALRQRDEARHQEAIALASYGFLTDDLIGRVDPAHADGAEETLSHAVRRAAAEIDTRFAASPLVAARLHNSIALAYKQRSEWDASREAFTKAVRAYAAAGAEHSDEAVVTRLDFAQMEAGSLQPGALERARVMIDAERKALKGQTAAWPQFKLAQAEALLEWTNDIKLSEPAFARARAIAEQHADAIPKLDAIIIRRQHAIALTRIDRVAEAIDMLENVVTDLEAMFGPDHPNTLRARHALLSARGHLQDFPAIIAEVGALLPRFEERLGRDHEYTGQLLSARYEAFGLTERYREAAADATRVWESAVRREGRGSEREIGARIDIAAVQCRDGDPAARRAGMAHARAAVDGMERTFGADYLQSQIARFYLGECLLATGDPAAAMAAFARIDPVHLAEWYGDPHWHRTLNLSRAEAALGLGRRSEARELLASVTQPGLSAISDTFQIRRIERLQKIAED